MGSSRMKGVAPRFCGSAYSSRGRPVPNHFRARGGSMLVPRDIATFDYGLSTRAVSQMLARAKVTGTGPCPVPIAPENTMDASFALPRAPASPSTVAGLLPTALCPSRASRLRPLPSSSPSSVSPQMLTLVWPEAPPPSLLVLAPRVRSIDPRWS
jgi:hypothetical protein